jgi:hypothetical protein
VPTFERREFYRDLAVRVVAVDGFLHSFKAACAIAVRCCCLIVQSSCGGVSAAGKTYKEAMLFPNALPFTTDKVCENKYIAAHSAC